MWLYVLLTQMKEELSLWKLFEKKVRKFSELELF